MAKAPKPAAVLAQEKKSHMTKEQLESRKAAEAALLSGQKMREHAAVKADPVAHKEWKRVSKLMAAIEKSDALYENIINRYCLLAAEEASLLEERVKALEQDRVALALDIDKQLKAKRQMRFDIEKECCMTVAAALRTIPKPDASAQNPLLEALTSALTDDAT